MTKETIQSKPLPEPAKILLWDRKLREKPCEKVLTFDEDLAFLAQVLKSTCYSHNAYGLAAPQINIFKQVAVVHYPQDTEAFVMVNPIIDEINSKGEQTGVEGCLSLPGSHASGERCRNEAKVRRCMNIVYSYQDLTGRRIEAKASGMLARVIAHEKDHCDGWFFIDRVGDVSRSVVLRQYQNFVKTLKAQASLASSQTA